jgi:hypothetical protein
VGVLREGINNPSPTISEQQFEDYIDKLLAPKYGLPKPPYFKKRRQATVRYQRKAARITAERLT